MAPPTPTLTFNPVFTSYVGSQGLPTIPVDRHLAPPVDPGSLDRSLHIDVGQEKVNPYLARPEGLAPDDAWNDLPFGRIAQVEVSAVRGFRDGIEALPGRFDSMAKSLLAIPSLVEKRAENVTPQDVEHAMETTTDFALHANARVNSALATAPEAVTKNLSEKYAQGAKYVHDTPADTIAYDVGYQTAYHSPDIVAAIATDGLSAEGAAAGGSMRILATKGESWALESVATRELASGTIDEAAAAARAQAEHTAREAVQETLTEARVPSTTVDAAASSGSYGVAFFGKSNLSYYTAENATLGASGRSFFFMPLEDSAAVTNASNAARLTGNAPSALDAYMNQGNVYGISFPTEGLQTQLPTAADAGGWPHFLEGGNTAVALPDNGGFLVNPTREFVTPGGNTMPQGSVLFQLGPNGEWIPMRHL